GLGHDLVLDAHVPHGLDGGLVGDVGAGRVGGVAVLRGDDHLHAVGGEEERGGGAGRAGTDDEDVGGQVSVRGGHGLHLLGGLGGGGGVGGGQDDVEAAGCPGAVAHVPAVRGRGAGGLLLELLDERVLHPEHGVADLDLRVTLDEDVGDQRAHAVRGDHEVQVRGAQRGASDGLEHLADRPVVGGWG